jgi:hypothetical protein
LLVILFILFEMELVVEDSGGEIRDWRSACWEGSRREGSIEVLEEGDEGAKEGMGGLDWRDWRVVRDFWSLVNMLDGI